MDTEMERYTQALGRLKGNLLSLEFSLRAFLLNHELGSTGAFPQSASLQNLKVDELVPVNAFTNYDTFGRLIDKYNAHVKEFAEELSVDKTLVDLRDALAHGRAFGYGQPGPLQLLKFDKPKDGRVRVAFSVSMTEGWFGSQIERVCKAVANVQQANQRLQRER